ncbi:MAG: hypothetical protein JXO51_07295 [Candidatus Aminicenantes bacterium]|nr:hypothetical protein [Candidatus Aminicenantes bacterium]
MSKKTVFLFAGISLAASLAADVGFFFSFASSQRLKVFTADAIWNKEPQPSFADTLLVLSSFQPNRQEFIVFGNIIRGRGVPIENGLWDTRKVSLGMGAGKVLSIPVSLAEPGLAFALDFSAGPYFYIFLSNHYTHLEGEYKKEVEAANILKRVQYGLYSCVRLRLNRYKEYLRALDVSLGLHFFLPFSNHEFNDDPKARCHLFKAFFFAGISF